MVESVSLSSQTEKAPEAAKGDLMGGLAAMLAARAKVE